ncbi:hypothetical protein SSX86_014713 [Deinandra increscens subsp. villosa]|uniref:NAC domain-containing protein n=1 Tax=Deinandra increscens subsp. villosa TaxID=3103831 RepID=A0AAP0D6Z7_9ASTR
MEPITTPSSPTPKTHPLPIGYRFCPTDEEIVIHYLRPKVLSLPLPATAVINSDDLFLHHPSRFSGDRNEKRYFFHKPGFTNNQAPNSTGYWKPVIKNGNTHKLILATGCNHPIGFKKSFVFYEFSDHRRSGSRTPWILHQFSLLYPLPINKIQEQWMVCSIHKKLKNVKSQRLGPAKRLKKSHYECERIDDDSSSGITFDGDLDDRKQDWEEEESRVN